MFPHYNIIDSINNRMTRYLLKHNLVFFFFSFHSLCIRYFTIRSIHYNPCNHYCPYCTKEQEKMIRAISRVGISKFLVDYLIKSAHEQYTPLQLAKKLLQYPNVGRDIYGRRNSKKASSLSETSITILQLISPNILHIDVNEGKNPIGICNCISQFSSPCPRIMVRLIG